MLRLKAQVKPIQQKKGPKMTSLELRGQVEHRPEPKEESRSESGQINGNTRTGKNSVPVVATQSVLGKSQVLEMERIGRVRPNIVEHQRGSQNQSGGDQIAIEGVPVEPLPGLKFYWLCSYSCCTKSTR